MLLRHFLVAVVAALVVIQPVLSRPSKAETPEAAEPTPTETRAALERDIAASDPGPSKKPAKRSQVIVTTQLRFRNLLTPNPE